LLAIVFAVGLLAEAAYASPQVYTVSGTTDPTAAACSGTVCPSLRDAVNEANSNPGSTIQLGSATYQLSELSLGALSLTASMTIIGNGPGSTTIAQTDGHDHVITVGSGPTVTIQGVTISGGEVSGAPGCPAWTGVRCWGVGS